MHPTSDAQAAAYRSGAVAGLEQVRDGLWMIAFPLDRGYLPSAFGYLLEDVDGGLHLVDAPGIAADSLAHLDRALRALGRRLSELASVTVTHLHPDHLGLAAELRAATGARIGMHEAEQRSLREPVPDPSEHLDAWGVPEERRADVAEQPAPVEPVESDVVLHDGDRLDIPGREIRVLHTPGHTRGSVCFVEPAAGVVLTGDHLLPDQFSGAGTDAPRTGNPIAEHLDSLQRVGEMGDLEVLPGHGWRFRGLADRSAAHVAHHRRRTAEVAAVLAAEPGLSVWEIASRLTWTAGWEKLRSFYARSALNQTAWHIQLAQSA